ncbi:hypothetical protein F4678DRAFT_453837 [Xylaria arbuscula]|nr:hypothetical protein F4678DRAFT_453837 [Xylaria arbuscula]
MCQSSACRPYLHGLPFSLLDVRTNRRALSSLLHLLLSSANCDYAEAQVCCIEVSRDLLGCRARDAQRYTTDTGCSICIRESGRDDTKPESRYVVSLEEAFSSQHSAYRKMHQVVLPEDHCNQCSRRSQQDKSASPTAQGSKFIPPLGPPSLHDVQHGVGQSAPALPSTTTRNMRMTGWCRVLFSMLYVLSMCLLHVLDVLPGDPPPMPVFGVRLFRRGGAQTRAPQSGLSHFPKLRRLEGPGYA